MSMDGMGVFFFPFVRKKQVAEIHVTTYDDFPA